MQLQRWEIVGMILLLTGWLNGGMVKCKNNGMLFVNQYQIADPTPEVNPEFAPVKAIQTQDLGYLLAGWLVSDHNVSDGQMRDAWLMKVDARGKPKWSKVFWHNVSVDDSWKDPNERFGDIVRVDKSTYVATGYLKDGTGVSGAMVVSIQGGGKINWKNFYRLNYLTQAGIPNIDIKSTVPLADGSVLLVGNGAVPFWDEKGKFEYMRDMGIVMRLDESGNVMWAKAYNHPVRYIQYVQEGEEWHFGSAMEKDGELYIQGSSWSSDEGEAMFLVKLDANGNFVWGRRYKEPVDENYSVWDVTAQGLVDTGDGMMLAWEDTEALCCGNGAINRAFLLKMDDDGNLKWAQAKPNYGIWEGNHLIAMGKGKYLWWYDAGGLPLKVDRNGRILRRMGKNESWMVPAPTRDGGAVYGMALPLAAPTELTLYKSNVQGNESWIYYWSDPEPLPKFTEVSEEFVMADRLQALVVDLPVVVKKTVVQAEKSRPIGRKKVSLLSKEGTKVNRRHRYHLVDKGIDEDVDGHWLHRYTLNYKGKVTGIIVAPYWIDGKGRKRPSACSAGAPTFAFGTKRTVYGYDGDNTYPKYVDCAMLDGRKNSVMVAGIHEDNPKEIHMLRMNGKPRKIWFPDMRQSGWAKGLFISILNEKQDATVLRYDFDTNATILLKLSCGSKK